MPKNAFIALLAIVLAGGVGLVLALLTMGSDTSHDADATPTGPAVVVQTPSTALSGTHSEPAVVTQTPSLQGETAPHSPGTPSLGSRAQALPKHPELTRQPAPRTSGRGASKHVEQRNIDGCDHAYGTPNQCVPLKAAGGGAVTCQYLTDYGYFDKPLLVHSDPLGLMTKPGVKMGLAADGKTMTVSGCKDS